MKGCFLLSHPNSLVLRAESSLSNRKVVGSIILKNLTLNGCMNCILVQCVVTDHNGEATSQHISNQQHGKHVSFPCTKISRITRDLTSFTMDYFLSNLGVAHFDLVKVDIEGSEYNLFMTSKDVLRRGIFKRIALRSLVRRIRDYGLAKSPRISSFWIVATV